VVELGARRDLDAEGFPRRTAWAPQVAVSGTITDDLSGVDPSTAVFAVDDEYGQIELEGPSALDVGGRTRASTSETTPARASGLL
jgi:hypothetical protein